MSVSQQAHHAYQHLIKLGSKKLSDFLVTHGPIEIPARYGHDPLIGLCRIVVGQQISGAAASKIWQSLEHQSGTRDDLLRRLGTGDEMLTGLSSSKRKTLQNIVLMGERQIESLHRGHPDVAQEALLAVPGIGPWTLSMWQLFVQRLPDCWSDNDLVLKRWSQVLADDANQGRAALIESARPFRSYLALCCWKLNSPT